jgi:hypothetical protein
MSGEHDALLQRHLPFLKYDSHECYFADSPAEWTDYEANRLQRGDDVLAEAKPSDGDGEPRLSLDFLAAKYPDGSVADKGDLISDTRRDYADASALLHQKPEYANRIYGRFVEDEERKEKWLQYWFFYFYNDFNLVGSFIGAGRHEGDWEMIQLRLGEGDTPDYAVYAQHRHAGVRHWQQVERLPGSQRPVVYVARGSHASYFEPGPHGTGAWIDWADGGRPRESDSKLEIVREGEPQWEWLRWPGHWGDTKPTSIRLPFLSHAVQPPFDSDSPVGPAMHKQWNEPHLLAPDLSTARPPIEGVEPATIPRMAKVRATRSADGLTVDYEVQGAEDADLRGLVVTVNSPDEKTPPRTHAVKVEAPAGQAHLPLQLDPAKRYDVYASAAFADRSPTESRRSDIDAV